MSSQPYQNLAHSLKPLGILCQFQTPGQLVISRQTGPIWPDRGNSFWVTHAGGVWHLFTWVPVGYRLPDSARIAELCAEFIAFNPRAAFEVPDEMARRFGLVELSDDEAEAV